MSWEAWGDDDDDRYDHLLDAGWIDGDEARDLRGKLLALSWERMVIIAAIRRGSERELDRALLYSEADCINYGAASHTHSLPSARAVTE